MEKLFVWALNMVLVRSRKIPTEQGIEEAIIVECKEVNPLTYKKITIIAEDYDGNKIVLGSCDDATFDLVSIEDAEE